MKATDEFFNLPPTPSVTGAPGAVHGIMDGSCYRVAPFHPQPVFGGFCATLLVGERRIEMLVVIGGFCDGICVFTRVVDEVTTAQITPKSPLFPYRMLSVGTAIPRGAAAVVPVGCSSSAAAAAAVSAATSAAATASTTAGSVGVVDECGHL